MTLEDIKEAVHNYDLIIRPYIIFTNERGSKILKEAIPDVEDKAVIKIVPFIEDGKYILADRKIIEDPWKGE